MKKLCVVHVFLLSYCSKLSYCFTSILPTTDRARTSLLKSSFAANDTTYLSLFAEEPSSPLPPTQEVTSGLSKLHQSILSRSRPGQQAFVTGQYPLTVTLRQSPTRRWLRWESTSELLVNGTTLSRSLASLDRFQWLDDRERKNLIDAYALVSLEFVAEIHTERPGFLQVMPSLQAGSTAAFYKNLGTLPRWKMPNGALLQATNRLQGAHDVGALTGGLDAPQQSSLLPADRLWITGFSLASRRGHINYVDADTGEISSINERSRASLLWPNEVAPVPQKIWGQAHDTTREQKKEYLTSRYRDALLVCDGFLVPGKDRGGLYVVKYPGSPENEWAVPLTAAKSNWFYHKACFLDLTGDGRLSVLTARCKVSPNFSSSEINNGGVTSGITKQGQLVMLECPKPFRIDKDTGTPLEADGTVFDPLNTCHLPWKEKVLATGPDVMFCVADLDPHDDTVEVLCSEFFENRVTLKSILRGPIPAVVFERVIDDRCGTAFSCILADLDEGMRKEDRYPVAINSGSTVPCLEMGDKCSHLLITSHECAYPDTNAPSQDAGSQNRGSTSEMENGGSLFSYRIPLGRNAWKTEPWLRSTVATGFTVETNIRNMINPGAPGFVYTFHAQQEKKDRRPLIAVAGDCSQSAYIYRPTNDGRGSSDPSSRYALMVEIECDATVGSIAVGYDDFLSAAPDNGYAKLFIPCFEQDKILVFALGSGDDGLDSW